METGLTTINECNLYPLYPVDISEDKYISEHLDKIEENFKNKNRKIFKINVGEMSKEEIEKIFVY